MSSPARLSELDREMQLVSGMSVLLSETVAARVGINCTDLECLGTIQLGGAASAGELATLTGLSSGAITGVIDRLEQAGYVRREADPSDRRKVLVRPEPRSDEVAGLFQPLQDDLHKYWSRFDDAQIALVIEFLSGSRLVAERHVSALQACDDATPAKASARAKRR